MCGCSRQERVEVKVVVGRSLMRFFWEPDEHNTLWPSQGWSAVWFLSLHVGWLAPGDRACVWHNTFVKLLQRCAACTMPRLCGLWCCHWHTSTRAAAERAVELGEGSLSGELCRAPTPLECVCVCVYCRRSHCPWPRCCGVAFICACGRFTRQSRLLVARAPNAVEMRAFLCLSVVRRQYSLDCTLPVVAQHSTAVAPHPRALTHAHARARLCMTCACGVVVSNEL
jgi:hypothetical protein